MLKIFVGTIPEINIEINECFFYVLITFLNQIKNFSLFWPKIDIFLTFILIESNFSFALPTYP